MKEEVIVGRTGSQPFKITDKNVSRQHLKATLLDDGRVEVEDLGSQSGTFLSGVRILRKVLSPETELTLGPSYKLRISDVFKKESQAAGSQQHSSSAPSSYSILPLKEVWDRYKAAIDALDSKNRRINLMSRITPAFTLGGAAFAAFSGKLNLTDNVEAIALTFTAVALLVTILSVYQSFKFDYKKEREKIQDKFEKEYVCPNPECRHFLGTIKYDLLVQNKRCNYCRCEFKD